MLFPKRFWAGIADGSITVTVRRWRRVQAIAGRRYRTAAGMIEVEAVDEIDGDALTAGDARAAGYPRVEQLLGDLPQRDDAALYRIRFQRSTNRTRAMCSPPTIAWALRTSRRSRVASRGWTPRAPPARGRPRRSR